MQYAEFYEDGRYQVEVFEEVNRFSIEDWESLAGQVLENKTDRLEIYEDSDDPVTQFVPVNVFALDSEGDVITL